MRLVALLSLPPRMALLLKYRALSPSVYLSVHETGVAHRVHSVSQLCGVAVIAHVVVFRLVGVGDSLKLVEDGEHIV